MKKPLQPRTSLKVLAIAGLLFLSLPFRTAEATPPSDASILYIGDSISDGNFGQEMDNALRTVSSNVVSEASCGSAPVNWLMTTQYAKTDCGYWKQTQPINAQDKNGIRTSTLRTPTLSTELTTYKPETVVIQLGTNIAVGLVPKNAAQSATSSTPSDCGINPAKTLPPASASAIAYETKYIDQMLQMVTAKDSGRKCIWVGPPDACTPTIPRVYLDKTTSILKTETAKYGCAFVDTQSFTHYPPTPANVPVKSQPDGIHPLPGLATTWGKQAASQVLPHVYADLGITPPVPVPPTSGDVSAPAETGASSATQ